MLLFRPLPLSCWEDFLRHNGYVCKRTKGSYDHWTKKGCRTIPVWGNEKEVPVQHLESSCRTIGCTMDEVYVWVALNT